jgi:hypothetical protein
MLLKVRDDSRVIRLRRSARRQQGQSENGGP